MREKVKSLKHVKLRVDTTGKHTHDGRKKMKEAGTSNKSHVSRKPLQYIAATTPVTGHVVEVTFWNHCNAYDLFSNLQDTAFF